MNKKKTFITLGLLFSAGLVIIIYIFFQPHRDVQNTNTDFSLNSSEIVLEYLVDANKANDTYLDEEGESKVLEVKGIISDISEDFNKQKVVLLKSETDQAGVQCTFTIESGNQVESLRIGDEVIIKGEIESGASYDEDLEMYENVIMGNCALLK